MGAQIKETQRAGIILKSHCVGGVATSGDPIPVGMRVKSAGTEVTDAQVTEVPRVVTFIPASNFSSHR